MDRNSRSIRGLICEAGEAGVGVCSSPKSQRIISGFAVRLDLVRAKEFAERAPSERSRTPLKGKRRLCVPFRGNDISCLPTYQDLAAFKATIRRQSSESWFESMLGYRKFPA